MKLPEVPYADGIGKRGQLQFYGLDHNLGAGDGGLWDMQNLTSDYYPVLSTRAKRKIYKNLVNPGGLFAWDALAWVEGTAFYYGGTKKGDVTAGEKRFAAIGAYIIILPDKKYYNCLADEFGTMEASFTGSAKIQDGTYAGEDAKANTIYASGARVYYLTDWMCMFIILVLAFKMPGKKWRDLYYSIVAGLGVWNLLYQVINYI